MEILSPAGSLAALKSAVYNGADAVYLGVSEFNARMGAENFDEKTLPSVIDFCHERGVRVHSVLNTLVSDREMQSVLNTAQKLVNAGVDAFIIQDLGLAAELLKRTDIDLHASTQLTVHSLDGALFLADMGFRRVVLSRELSRKEIEYITAHSPVEIEVFAHGAMCMSYSGQCYMSSLIGGRSGNRGRCAQPCRLPYRNGYSLSLKDMCLLKYVSDLKNMGVCCLKIEGRMKGEEYVGAVTRAYAEAVRGKEYSSEEEDFLAGIFSRDGFSDGYYTGKIGKSMFGVRGRNTERFNVEAKEFKRFKLNYSLTAVSEDEIRISAVTSDGYSAETAVKYETAKNRQTEKEDIIKALSKLGDTVYSLGEISFDLPCGIFIPLSALNTARRELCSEIAEMRRLAKSGFNPIPVEIPSEKEGEKKNLVQCWFLKSCSAFINDDVSVCWLPVTEISTKSFDKILSEGSEKIGVWLPQTFSDFDLAYIRSKLNEASKCGIKKVLVNNVGQIELCKGFDFEIHGDYGLNVFNGVCAEVLEERGVKSLTLSFEGNMAALEDMRGKERGVIVYGRLPLMCVRNCVKTNNVHCSKNANMPLAELVDRTGKAFPVSCEMGCRNRIWNSDILYLADKSISDFNFYRFIFTDEDKNEAEAIVNQYLGKEPLSIPENMTRGLYFRKVQ